MENPDTWTTAERIVSNVIDSFNDDQMKPAEHRRVSGLSLVRQITDALRAEGLLLPRTAGGKPLEAVRDDAIGVYGELLFGLFDGYEWDSASGPDLFGKTLADLWDDGAAYGTRVPLPHIWQDCLIGCDDCGDHPGVKCVNEACPCKGEPIDLTRYCDPRELG